VIGKRDRFREQVWLAAFGLAQPPKPETLRRATACDADACDLRNVAGDLIVSLVFRPIAFGDVCGQAALVVSALDAPPWCAGPHTRVIDQGELARRGSLSIALGDDVWAGKGLDRLPIVAQSRSVDGRLWQVPAER